MGHGRRSIPVVTATDSMTIIQLLLLQVRLMAQLHTSTANVSVRDFYGGVDPSEAPLYTYAAAARALKLPESTVRWWVKGRDTKYQPVIKPESSSLLSFNDLLELYTVKVLRKNRGVTLPAIRRAVAYAQEQQIPRVLISEDLAKFGGEVLLAGLNDAVAISLSGQQVIYDLIKDVLQRVDRKGLAAPVLHPDFDGEKLVDNGFPISVSPVVSFGSPTLSGTSIRTAIIKNRVDSGESVNDISRGYEVAPELVSAALRFEHAIP